MKQHKFEVIRWLGERNEPMRFVWLRSTTAGLSCGADRSSARPPIARPADAAYRARNRVEKATPWPLTIKSSTTIF